MTACWEWSLNVTHSRTMNCIWITASQAHIKCLSLFFSIQIPVKFRVTGVPSRRLLVSDAELHSSERLDANNFRFKDMMPGDYFYCLLSSDWSDFDPNSSLGFCLLFVPHWGFHFSLAFPEWATNYSLWIILCCTAQSWHPNSYFLLVLYYIYLSK